MSDPTLRPTSPEGAPGDPPPPGRTTAPAGLWAGRAMEVVYDPAGHDVVFLRGAASPGLAEGLSDTGWKRASTDGENQMWIRDRSAAAGRRLERTACAALAATPPACRLA